MIYTYIMMLIDVIVKFSKSKNSNVQKIMKMTFWSFYDFVKTFNEFPIVFKIGSIKATYIRPEEKMGITKELYARLPMHFIIDEEIHQREKCTYFITKLQNNALGVLCHHEVYNSKKRWCRIIEIGDQQLISMIIARAMRGWETRSAEFIGSSNTTDITENYIEEKTCEVQNQEITLRVLSAGLTRNDESSNTGETQPNIMHHPSLTFGKAVLVARKNA